MKNLENFLEGKTHVIWDWNGTLLDDTQMCVSIISSLLTKHGYPPISIEEYRKVFRFPVREYYRDIGFEFNKVPFEVVAMEFIDAYNHRVHECSLFNGVAEVLDRLNEVGLQHSVLSAAQENDLKRLLEVHKLTEHFLHIYGISDHFAASKAARGRQLIEAISAPRNEIVMIGDTDHDIEVADEMGVDILLFADGHQCPTRLIKQHPNVLVRCRQGGNIQRYSD
jgi:phosphoglycolate phosphatase